ncbi:helix-turn-helix domain-containing protein [Bathymodiolus heckerae thiotrophic gill symbiont]|uniref:helix-turn-helix domain-containing protein n=1 Tax=Bathymodiolus heckerae thiotrophic gill symbiont TaxID=1052212 RepID=UPI0010FD8099
MTCEQKYHIYLLKKQGYSQTFIANSIGRSKPTISRELSRNSWERGLNESHNDLLRQFFPRQMVWTR